MPKGDLVSHDEFQIKRAKRVNARHGKENINEDLKRRLGPIEDSKCSNPRRRIYTIVIVIAVFVAIMIFARYLQITMSDLLAW